MTKPTDEKLFVLDLDGVYWFVARDADDAWALYEEWCGETSEDYPGADWAMLADDHALTINDEEPSGPSCTKTAAEWAAESGRGFLCSTEY